MNDLPKKIVFISIIALFLLLPLKSEATTKYNLPKLLPDCDQTIYVLEDGTEIPASSYDESMGEINKTKVGEKCGFADFVELLLNLFSYALAVLGAFVLFFFIWGGFNLIIAGGRQEKIQEGKNIIKGAFIGMIIVMVSWTLVSFWVLILSGDVKGELFKGESFSRFWWGSGDCHTKFTDSCKKDQLREGCGGPPGSSTDRYVRGLQQTLNDRPDCNCGPVDGCFGPQTTKCVTDFQIAHGIVEAEIGGVAGIPFGTVVYGWVGPKTWEQIKKGGGCTPTDLSGIEGLMDVSPLDPTKKYCCIPPESSTSSCINTDSENCNGLKSQGWKRETGSCAQYETCNIGCCVPNDLNDVCMQTSKDDCTVGTFKRQACSEINECKFICCVNGKNDCAWQRATVASGQKCFGGVYTAEGSPSTDLESICSDIDQCNMGVCAQTRTENTTSTVLLCAENVSRRQCNLLPRAEFFYDAKITVGNKISGTDIDCDPTRRLFVPD